MRKINFLVIILSVVTPAHAQQTKIDSLQYLMSNAKADTAKITLFEKLGQAYRDQRKLDSSIFCFKKALEINEHNNYSRHKQCLDIAAIQFLLYEAGNYAESLKYASRQMQLTDELKDLFQMAFANTVFAHNYKALGEYRQSVNYYLKARKLGCITFLCNICIMILFGNHCYHFMPLPVHFYSSKAKHVVGAFFRP